MKVVSTEALTKFIQLVKSAFIKVDDVVEVTEIETETPSEITLATVATSGDYNDLSNKPTIPSAVTEATVSGWGFTKNTGTVTSVNNVSPVNGNVTLSIPTVPTNVSAFTNDAGYITSSALNGYATQAWVGQQGYITGITSSDVTTALGYTPYNASNPSGYITSSALVPYALSADLASVATSGSYNDLSNKPTIPTVNNPTITFTQGGTTKGTITLNQSGNQTIALDAGGGARNIGEIIQSTIPLTDAGLHLLDGSVIQGNGIYSDFVTYIAGLVSTYPDLFETEANWQTSVTNYGVCGKFVYDSVNNTVRLPKITGIVEGTTDVTALGDLIEAGLPDFDAVFVNHARDYSPETDKSLTPVSGAIAVKSDMYPKSSYPNVGGRSAGSYYYDQTVEIRPSISNSIYGNSSTVQPQSIKVLYYIVIATSIKTDIEVDIDKIVTDLNGKADVDLSNCTKPHIVETYVNGTSWYRVYSDGWCEQGGGDITTSGNVNFLKPFINTNYCLVGSIGHGDKSQTWEHYDLRKESTNYFYQDCCFDGYRLVSWYACGYIS